MQHRRALLLRSLLPGPLLIATLAAIAYILQSGTFEGALSHAWIDREVRDQGVQGALLFVGVSAMAMALAVPRHIVSFMGGYAFGLGLGTLLALIATELGCVLAFCVARLVGRPLVSARLGPLVRRIEDFLAANPFSMTLLIRMLPGTNNLAICLAAGASRAPARPFLLGSLVGYLPLTFVLALAGSGVEGGTALQVAVSILCFAASGAIGVWLYRKYRRGRVFLDKG
jgi:uncharacterized membrane protein YdjX (TVP38/TMEM64 family)